jgi:threonine/homoserine/homoserine lactone efflux protein
VSLALLAATALPFVVSPGASFTMTIGAATAGDRRAPLKVWAGTALGIVIIAAIAGLSGIGQLIAENDFVRTVFGAVGGTVLIVIGISSLVKAVRASTTAEHARRSGPRLVLWAFLALITNLKALSLYALVVPTLNGVDIQGPALFLIFAIVHVTMLLAWLVLLGAAVNAVPVLGESQRARSILLLFAALTLVVLGALTIINAVN